MSGTRLEFASGILIQIACSLALCAGAVVTAVERAINWMLGVLPASNPRLAFAGDPITPTAAYSFPDPQVERHEAGLARLGAVRHI